MTVYRVFIEERRVQILNVEAPDAAAAAALAQDKLEREVLHSQAYQRTMHVTGPERDLLLEEVPQ